MAGSSPSGKDAIAPLAVDTVNWDATERELGAVGGPVLPVRSIATFHIMLAMPHAPPAATIEWSPRLEPNDESRWCGRIHPGDDTGGRAPHPPPAGGAPDGMAAWLALETRVRDQGRSLPRS
jgi:hypothetical protein